MPSPRAEAIARNYRLRLRALRAEMMRRVARAYAASLREEDIRASYDERFVPIAARTITAAQGGAQTLTRAYIRGAGGFEPLPVPPLAGTSKAGTMTAALVGIMPFILGAIAEGSTPTEALGLGQRYIDRMADNELTRVVDAEIGGQVSGQRVKGWIGIVNAPCPACADNAGEHTFDEEMYRHPFCRCDRELLFEEYAYTVPGLVLA